MLANPGAGLNKVKTITVMFFDAGGHRKYIRVKDNVLRIKLQALTQKPIGALANRDLARETVGLALLIKCHHDHRSTVTLTQKRLLKKACFAFFERYGIDNCLTLHAAQSCLDDRPFRAVNHDWHPRDIGFGGEHVQKAHHGRF